MATKKTTKVAVKKPVAKKAVAKKTVVSRAKPFTKTEKKEVKVKTHVRVQTAEGLKRAMLKKHKALSSKS